MGVKRKQVSNEQSQQLSKKQKKMKQRDNFFSDLQTDEVPEEDLHKKMSKKAMKKKELEEREENTKMVKMKVMSENKLKKYIKFKDVVDIDPMIEKYAEEENIRSRVEKLFEIGPSTVMLRDSEVARLERKEKEDDKDKKKKEEKEEIEDYFKDSISIENAKQFSDLFIDKRIMAVLDELQYKEPTPIQSACIPVALAGKDICGCAATGTGKTAAFMIPTIQRLLLLGENKDRKTRVLVVVPTRELSAQVFQVTASLIKNTNITVGIVAGGMSMEAQRKEILKFPDIIIATPGRLMYMNRDVEEFTLANIEVLVLDEADRVLDDNFEKQMLEIIDKCGPYRQSLLFSATMTTNVKRVALASLKKPVKIFVNSNQNVAQNLRQEYVLLRKAKGPGARMALLLCLLAYEFRKNTLVFLPTKALCHKMCVILRLCGLSVGELHSKIPQSARLSYLQKFANKEIDILLATDIAARGLDIKGVQTVINYVLTRSYSTYVHRVGRTARAGQSGVAVNIVSEDKFKQLNVIKKNSRSPIFKRVVRVAVIEKWRKVMETLSRVTVEILEKEKEMIESKKVDTATTQAEDKVKKMVRDEGKEDRVQEREKNMEKKTQKGNLRKNAKEAGLSVEDYMTQKRLSSMRVSNARKKKILRKQEAKVNPTLIVSKKKLSEVTFDPAQHQNTSVVFRPKAPAVETKKKK